MLKKKKFDHVYLGDEPKEGSDLTKKLDIMSALNYYNYFFDKKQSIEFLENFFRKNNPGLVVKVKRIPDEKFPTTLGWIARLSDRDCLISQETRDYFNKSLLELFKKYSRPKERKKTVSPLYPEYWFIAELDSVIDDFVNNKYKSDFNFSQWIVKFDIGPSALLQIRAHYQPLLEELLYIDKDAQLKEGYCNLTKAQKKSYIELIRSFVHLSEMALENRKRGRKPKKKTKEDLTKKFNFLAYDKDLNITSLQPAKITGASMAIFFNVRYRKIIVLTAKANEKLAIKGSTILNFDQDKSFDQILRKPKDTLPIVLKSGKRELKKVLDDLSTTQTKLDTGRINKHCLIIAVF